MHNYAVIDFETTGLSPAMDRVIEVAVVVVRHGQVAQTFDTLMNPGFRIPGFITNLTGISTAMVQQKPRPEQVMPKLRQLIGNLPCVAHNAAFDRGFFAAEMRRAQASCAPEFFCSMLLARRLVQDAPNHKLGPLMAHLSLPPPTGMQAHRALADTLMTVTLWQHLMTRVQVLCPGNEPDSRLIARLTRTPKAKVRQLLARVGL